MLTKLVVKLYGVILEVSLWLLLVAGLVGGWQASGFFGAVGGAIAAGIFGAVFFGAFLVLQDIRKTLEEMNNRKK